MSLVNSPIYFNMMALFNKNSNQITQLNVMNMLWRVETIQWAQISQFRLRLSQQFRWNQSLQKRTQWNKLKYYFSKPVRFDGNSVIRTTTIIGQRNLAAIPYHQVMSQYWCFMIKVPFKHFSIVNGKKLGQNCMVIVDHEVSRDMRSFFANICTTFERIMATTTKKNP